MNPEPTLIAVIIAHPDDETLWAGGTILEHPSWQVFIGCLCRKSDEERAEKFNRVLNAYKAEGKMGDLDDGPEQKPLLQKEVQHEILQLLPHQSFDLIITHHPNGEYTRHRRHEEIGHAVIKLWHSGKIQAGELWAFAYEDGNKAYYPRAISTATLYHELNQDNWIKKYKIMTEIYGFNKSSWEAKTTPKEEAFWRFTHADEAITWLNNQRR